MADKMQQHVIFSSTCTIQRKVYHYIVNSSACENVIAGDVVDKLCLTFEVHPAPYYLTWLQCGTATIAKCLLVSFSIGSTYSDSMWCDVVLMDACHLLLGFCGNMIATCHMMVIVIFTRFCLGALRLFFIRQFLLHLWFLIFRRLCCYFLQLLRRN